MFVAVCVSVHPVKKWTVCYPPPSSLLSCQQPPWKKVSKRIFIDWMHSKRWKFALSSSIKATQVMGVFSVEASLTCGPRCGQYE